MTCQDQTEIKCEMWLGCRATDGSGGRCITRDLRESSAAVPGVECEHTSLRSAIPLLEMKEDCVGTTSSCLENSIKQNL